MKWNHTIGRLVFSLAMLVPLTATAQEDAPDPVDTIAMADVPAVAVKAAQEARPGVVLQSARQVWWRDEGVYILEGVDYGKSVRIEVTSSGQVLNAYQTN